MCVVCAHLKLKSNKIRLVNLVELRGTGRQKTICVCNGGKRAQKLGSAESVKDFRKEFFSFSFSCFCANHQNFMSDLFNSRRDSIKIHCTLVFLSCDSFSPSWLSLSFCVFLRVSVDFNMISFFQHKSTKLTTGTVKISYVDRKAQQNIENTLKDPSTDVLL